MRALLHIGTEKTGTTSIQEFLHHNRKQLSTRGFHVLASAGDTNHRWVPSYCMADDRTDDFFNGLGAGSPEARRRLKAKFRERFDRELAELPADVHTVVVSSEHFHSRLVRQTEVDAVRDLLADRFEQVEIVCYLREQADMCVSLYSTAIKVGHTRDFGSFLEECTPDNLYYNYADLLAMWEKAFGRAALDVALFDPGRMLNRDLLDDFVARIHPSLVGALDKDIPAANESLSYTGQIVGRALNRAFTDGSTTGDQFIRREGRALVSEGLSGKGQQPEPEARRGIRAAFEDSNERIRARFFPDVDTLFPEGSGKVTDGTIDARFGDVLVELMQIIRLGGAMGGVPDEYANALRDAALLAEDENPEAAYRTMLLASAIRPSGERIRRKVAELRGRLR